MKALSVLFSIVYPVVEKFLGLNSSNTYIWHKNEWMNEGHHNTEILQEIFVLIGLWSLRGQREMFWDPKKTFVRYQMRSTRLSATFPTCQTIFKIPQEVKQATNTIFLFPDAQHQIHQDHYHSYRFPAATCIPGTILCPEYVLFNYL